MVVGSHLSVCAIFEILVVLFQLCGIMGLCLNRLMPRSTPWSSRGQVGLIVALFGLGIAGALCGRHDSEFALFAGGADGFTDVEGHEGDVGQVMIDDVMEAAGGEVCFPLLDMLLDGVAAGQQDQVRRVLGGLLAELAAHVGAVHAGHHPVDDGQAR